MQTGEFQLNNQRIVVAPDIEGLAQAAAMRLIEYARNAIRHHGAFHLALSGGSTPIYLHRALTTPLLQQQIEWEKVHIYFGDERNVPDYHPDSNYRMAYETLIAKVPIPPSQVHAIPTGCEDMNVCAHRYAELLTRLPHERGIPRFDLILLGMGDDGHTASLFPQTTILDVHDRAVATVFVAKLSAWRVSLTFPVLNQANAVMILVSGASKSDVLYGVFNEPARNYPIQKIHNPHTEWFVDSAAAARLLESDVGISG